MNDTAVVSLAADALRTLDGEVRPLAGLRGARVCAVAGIGWPSAFFAQLVQAGAHVDALAFPDHHRYTVGDIAAMRQRVPAGGTVVCTLKDAVKLAELWPREAGPIWYVSQRVEFERGVESVSAALDAAGRVRPMSSS